ncbi:GFA family protein [Thalassomonas viridans]|uniref:GFA family protein n=1 Tax=Thalassomonas viridans TaxID=137584 RepID=A0AAE9Z5R3_9GAMM|nr:GFA family protein [Thalassomonas viridans]WDE07113.1 GFA family protein [Thalassomonas viridans]
MPHQQQLQGTCLCKSVCFTLDGGISGVRYCHCSNCRKFAGTSPAAWGMAETAKLNVTTANNKIGKFNSGRGIRCFCLNCGSPLWFESIEYPHMLAIPLGVLDNDRLPAPEQHIWTQSSPSWCSIHDQLPRHPNYPEKTPE